MDPDNTLFDLRSDINELFSLSDDEIEARLELGQRIAERADVLDTWLTTGGFVPADWTPNTRAV